MGSKLNCAITVVLYLFRVSLQKRKNGPAMECCVQKPGSCNGPAGLCIHFYDSAPSGRFGTMSYLAQAVASELRGISPSANECKIS